jgi:hypothetical protein
MRLLSLLAAVAAALTVVGGASAAPNPDVNKNAVPITLACGGTEITIYTIFQNHATAAQLVGGGAAVMVGYTLFDNPARSGDPIFEYLTPGFAHNGQALVTCDFELPQFDDAWFTGQFMVTP